MIQEPANGAVEKGTRLLLTDATDKILKRWKGATVTLVEDADSDTEKIKVQVISYDYNGQDEEHWEIPPYSKTQTEPAWVSRQYLRRLVGIDKTYFEVPAPLVVAVCMGGNCSYT